MKSIDPACGFSLQSATQMCACFGIFLSIANYIVALSGIKSTMEQHQRVEYEMFANVTMDDPSTGPYSSVKGVYSWLFILISLLVFCGVVLDVFLFAAAKKCNLKQCRTWFMFSASLWIVTIIDHTYTVVDEGYTPQNITTIIYLLIDMYILWVVLAFMHELEVRSRSRDSDWELEQVRTQPF